MKIGLFTDTYFPQVSGVATSIKTLKDALEEQGHEVYIFTTTDPKVSKDEKEERIFRFSSLPYFGFKDRRLTFRGLIRAVEIAKEVDLDIVHTQTEFSLGLIGKYVARRLKIPAIHTYHTMYEDYTHYVAKGILLRPSAVSHLVKAYLKSMNGVIAPSERVKESLLSYGVDDIPIPVIPTGVAVKELGDGKEDLHAKYGIAKDAPVVLSLGRLAFEKNIAMTISAFSEILETVPNARLVIAGDGPAKKSLQEQVEDLELQDSITFVGMVDHDQVADYYRLATVFVSSSDSETQGLTFIEALASDRPFVAIHSPYLDQLVKDPAIGQLVDDYDEFRDAVESYLKRPFSKEDEEIRKQAVKNVDATTFGKRVFDFYETIIHNYEQDETEDDSDQLNDDEIGYIKRLLRNPFRRN
ncbi:glycosyltransferase family 4 protein [Fructobacillus sp. M1-13]|uniref:Glycosyltransferase family 4 protein n=1 Tax=Fructobacillus papyriferae TaxID=2713171 RepID=A0ABS5QRF1_9LACO|nr:glycosyltransferase family 4 protein [Fructobacillus papyriferae]MBS9335402.1 glycosyltransferase family 4 protein [Fructobacillus papyriferae]MCD2158928.1 glycosyltransferase family 4 protein [Fructobacillus papyriferae]